MINAAKLQRASHWLYVHHVPLLPKLFQLMIFFMYNCNVHPKVEIGINTEFSHCGIGVLINANVKIGNNCVIGNNCSVVGQKPYKKVPQIGNNVYIGMGAVIQGPVIIEDNVVIGANSVVNKSVKSDSIVAGIPAKVIGKVSELPYDFFNGKADNDSVKDYL